MWAKCEFVDTIYIGIMIHIFFYLGGPLFQADIEDFKGRPHLQCPWHGYLFDAETGKNQSGIMVNCTHKYFELIMT